MKKVMVIILSIAYLVVAAGAVSPLYAQETIVDNIESVKAANELAAKAEGKYVDGATAPALQGDQVALPVQDASGNTLGHIVADRKKLIAVLNEAGMTDVASALGAIETGTAAGGAAMAGLSAGTIGKIVVGVALVAGVAVAAGGGGGGGITTTSHH